MLRGSATRPDRPTSVSIRLALVFLTRIPFGPDLGDAGAGALQQALRYAPLAGVAVAALQAVVVLAGAATGLPTLAIAALALAMAVVATGGLHEDGLADLADGFGGGGDAPRKLAIMRDSRIGTYGALALGCSLLTRTAALAQVIERSGAVQAVAVLMIAATSSRALMLIPLAVLPPARADGLAHAVGSLPRSVLAVAVALAGIACAAAGVLASLSGLRVTTAAAGAAAACGLCTILARRQIGGVTGDVVGASQQAAECVALLVLSAGLP